MTSRAFRPQDTTINQLIHQVNDIFTNHLINVNPLKLV